MMIIAEKSDRCKFIEKNFKKNVKCAATQQNTLATIMDVNTMRPIFRHIVVGKSLPMYMHSQYMTDFDKNNGFIFNTNFYEYILLF